MYNSTYPLRLYGMDRVFNHYETIYPQGTELSKNEMREEWKKNACNFLGYKIKRKHLEDLVADGRIILAYILKQEMKWVQL